MATATAAPKETAPKIPRGLKGRPPEEIVPGRAKVLIFGSAGVGKSFTCINFPNTYYIDAEGGAELPEYAARLKAAGAWYMGRADGASDVDTVTEQVKLLATTEHDRKTLIIDSATKLLNVACAVEEDKILKANQKNEFSRDRKMAMPKFRRLFGWIDKLDMNVIVVCHEKDKWEKGESVGVTYDGPEKWDYDLHLTARIIRLGNGTTRRMKIVKSRLSNFPEAETIGWSYNDFADRYGRHLLEAEHKAVQLATIEQAALIPDLIRRTKTAEDQAAKWLEQAHVESWSELPADWAEKLITHLTGVHAAQQKGA